MQNFRKLENFDECSSLVCLEEKICKISNSSISLKQLRQKNKNKKIPTCEIFIESGRMRQHRSYNIGVGRFRILRGQCLEMGAANS